MAKLFQDNSYNVLGLDTSATQKDLNKRAKEIINLLRIEEEPSYDTDLGLIKIKRQENIVKDAVQKLNSPTKRIKEYFFWFDIENDSDEKAIKLLKDKKINEAISVWEEPASKETASGFVAKKNLAILTSLLLLQTGQKKYLTQSIGYWKDLLQSEKFWPHFEKLYALNDEVGTSKAVLTDFTKKVTDDLSDFYSDVSEVHKDRSYYSLFSQIFAVKGQRMQRDVLSPIYEAIHDASESLAHLNISDDNIISDDEIRTVKQLLRKLQDNFEKLKELGLYSDSQSKTMRDKAAEALRTVALDIYNNLNEAAKPAALLNAGIKIAGTAGLQQKLNRDIDQLRRNTKNENIIKPINDLLADEKFAEALDLIESKKEQYKHDKDLTAYFNTRIQWCVTGIAAKDFVECKKLFDKGKLSEANSNFLGLRDFIIHYLDYFNFNKEAIHEVMSEIDRMLTDVNQISANNVDAYREQVVEGATKTFSEQFEETILIILVDSSIYANLARQLPAIKRKRRIKSWIWWIVILLIIAVVSASGSDTENTDTTTGSDSSSGSTDNSAYNQCVEEANAIKEELDSINAQMDRYEANDDIDSFNALVPRQNELVRQGNEKVDECNSL